MDTKLEYCGNYIKIRDFHHYIDDEKTGNPYNCSFDIMVKSGVFTSIADGCEYDYKELQKFIVALEDLISFKRKDVTFCEIGYGTQLNSNVTELDILKYPAKYRAMQGVIFLNLNL